MRPSAKEALNHPFIKKSYEQGTHSKGLKMEAHAIIDGFFGSLRTFAEQPMLVRAALSLIAHFAGDQLDAQRLAFSMLDRRRSAGQISPDSTEAVLEQVPEDIDELFDNADSNRN